MSLIKKENITIVIGTYEKDGETKKQFRTIGELITMQGDDGQPYQFGKLWGASGCTEIKIYPQDDNRTTAGQNQQQPMQQPQGQYQQPNGQPMSPQQVQQQQAPNRGYQQPQQFNQQGQ